MKIIIIFLLKKVIFLIVKFKLYCFHQCLFLDIICGHKITSLLFTRIKARHIGINIIIMLMLINNKIILSIRSWFLKLKIMMNKHIDKLTIMSISIISLIYLRNSILRVCIDEEPFALSSASSFFWWNSSFDRSYIMNRNTISKIMKENCDIFSTILLLNVFSCSIPIGECIVKSLSTRFKAS